MATKAAGTKVATKNAASKKGGGKKSAGKKAASNAENYTNPALREKIKDAVMRGDKGGKAGQWSARKAQMVAHEYEAHGGGYKHERTETQEHLKEWGEEKWRTADGTKAIKEESTSRYLPEKAWDELSPAEQKATEAKKREGSKTGKQHVPNTAKAKAARKLASK